MQKLSYKKWCRVLQLCKLNCMLQQNEAYKPLYKSVSSPNCRVVKCALQVGRLLHTDMSGQTRYVLSNTHCQGARALHSSTDDMLLFPCAGMSKPSLSMSPAASLVRPVDLFICGHDENSCTCHSLYTHKVLPAIEHARHQCYRTALQPNAVLLQTMASKILHSCKHQMKLVPAKDVAKALCKGEAMSICALRWLVLFCQHL